jgi:hypothetical protein
MNLMYNTQAFRFEAEFHEFQGDLGACKSAGFRYDGGPRVWHTSALKVLNKLRQHKPQSGLTITPEAFAVYQRMTETEEKNKAIKKQFKAAVKESKKNISNWLPSDKMYLTAEDVKCPAEAFHRPESKTVSTPHGECIYCGQPTYIYESVDACLWCERDEQKLLNTDGICGYG